MIVGVPSYVNPCPYLHMHIKYCLDLENIDAMLLYLHENSTSMLSARLKSFALWVRRKRNWSSAFNWIEKMYKEYENFEKSPSTYWDFISKCEAEWIEFN